MTKPLYEMEIDNLYKDWILSKLDIILELIFEFEDVYKGMLN